MSASTFHGTGAPPKNDGVPGNAHAFALNSADPGSRPAFTLGDNELAVGVSAFCGASALEVPDVAQLSY